ncbi:hypothetical protein A499_11566 [Niallia nealsonii AAU1]|nr:hypothetical protein A499_11566 [Niallia nealsonii AAU1]
MMIKKELIMINLGTQILIKDLVAGETSVVSVALKIFSAHFLVVEVQEDEILMLHAKGLIYNIQ